MLDILVRAGCFVAIIILGQVLRRVGFFKEDDFKILSKILLKLTLPAAIVSSFIGKELDPTMLMISLIGFGVGVIYIVLAYVQNLRAGKEKQIFEIVNASGYNIGAFTMPFAQGFLGSMGVITTSLFDIGNAFICLGGSLGVGHILKDGGRFSIKKIGKSLIKSVAFDCYIIMAIVSLAKIPIPSPIASLAEIIGNANAFVAMLMIGVGFNLSGDRKQMRTIIRILAVRYGVGIVVALACYFLLPFPLEMRQALVILAFSPFPSSGPAYTEELQGDVGLASALNSVSIVCSIVIIVSILLVML